MDASEEVLGEARRENELLERAERVADLLNLEHMLGELETTLRPATARPTSFPCPECRATVPWEAARCPRCGVGFLSEEGACPFCGATISPLATRCRCGAEVAR